MIGQGCAILVSVNRNSETTYEMVVERTLVSLGTCSKENIRMRRTTTFEKMFKNKEWD